MNKVKILVVDDHEVVRKGVCAILNQHPGWEVCAEAVNGREAVEKSQQLLPDLVVMDLTMPELNGVDATRQVLKVSPKTQVIILTVHDTEQLAREIVEAGARGYVLKSNAGQDLITAVESLLEGRVFLASKTLDAIREAQLPDRRDKTTTRASRELLTSREREVLQLLAEGKSSKDVAIVLEISASTVETHRTNILKKLQLHSMAELVRYAVRNKIVEA